LLSKSTLITGSVKINNSILVPGQAFTNKVTTTDISQDIAWRKGLFNFNKQSLEEVMRQLSRWYDIDIIYKTPIPKIDFYGKVQRSLNLNDVLEVLSGMGVKFEIKEGRKLEVSKA
ncbi:MAG: DUF4974 domain-containing protein, partial [Chitinophagaceae bacterium]|nr:DUF4974 domain-containing protein [Chitinophagaceae bacterium]